MPWDLLFLLLLEISEFTDCFAIPEGICFFRLIDYRTPWGLLFFVVAGDFGIYGLLRYSRGYLLCPSN